MAENIPRNNPRITIVFNATDFESYRELKQKVVDAFEHEFCYQLTTYSGTLSSIARALRMDRKHLSDLFKKHGIKLPPLPERVQRGIERYRSQHGP